MTDIVRTSFFKNSEYNTKIFDEYDRIIYLQPYLKILKFSINTKLQFKSILCNELDVKSINIKSNCMFLRPTVLVIKMNI